MKWYVVNVQNLCIDTEWDDFGAANARARELIDGGLAPGAAKVMTQPRVGKLKLDPQDSACWKPKRNNPGKYAFFGTEKEAREYRNSLSDPEAFQVRWRHVNDDFVVEPVPTEDDEEVEENPRLGNPAAFVKTKRDERLWKKAKKSAAEQGRKNDWPYITGIFKRMQQRVGGGELRENPSKCPEEFEDWRPDEIAECVSGLSNETYRRLWEITADLERTGKAVPLGGDGSDDTIEYPPEYGSYKSGKMAANWHKLDAGMQREIVECFKKDYGRPRENPGELLVVNPADVDSAKAEAVYKLWHQKEPRHVSILDTGCDANDIMVCVGKAHNIVYRSGKWQSGRKTEDYVHHFDSKPSVYMLAGVLESETPRQNPGRTVESLLSKAKNADGQFAVADLATPLSFGLDDGTTEGVDIDIHSGSRVYGAVDQKTVIILDPHWGIVVIKGGKMFFDERGIVN